MNREVHSLFCEWMGGNFPGILAVVCIDASICSSVTTTLAHYIVLVRHIALNLICLGNSSNASIKAKRLLVSASDESHAEQLGVEPWDDEVDDQYQVRSYGGADVPRKAWHGDIYRFVKEPRC